MLTVDLVRLEREGFLRLRAEIPADDALWEGVLLAVGGAASVELTATLAGSGEIVVRGVASVPLTGECSRCLREVTLPVEQSVTMVFAPVDELGDEDQGDVRRLSASAVEFDLAIALREELILSLPQSLLCSGECRGFCSGCGVDLNQKDCQCPGPEIDPRWAGLKALNNE